MGANALNPYRSPHSVDVAWPVRGFDEGPIHAVLLEAAWRFRRVRLVGRVEAELEWNARWPIEFVRVNGRKVQAKSAFWYAQRFQFDLETSSHPVSIQVEVELSLLDFMMWDAVNRFAVLVDEELVYQELE